MRKLMFNDKVFLTYAVLNGIKTQTRRNKSGKPFKVGEVLAVAQSYRDAEMWSNQRIPNANQGEPSFVLAGDTAGWKNKMFVQAHNMPHQIEVVGVREERLQDISEEDCKAEGITQNIHGFWGFKRMRSNGKIKVIGYPTAKQAYAKLIDIVSGKGTWESNPLVYVYEFKLIK